MTNTESLLGYVYRIEVNDEESNLNGCYYFGFRSVQFRTLEEMQKDGYFGSGQYIKKYRQKRGTSHLEKTILEVSTDEAYLRLLENEIIQNLFLTDSYASGGFCLNLKEGGGNGRLSEITKSRIGLANTNPAAATRKLMSVKKVEWIKEHSERHREISQLGADAQKTPEARERQSSITKKQWEDPEYRNKKIASTLVTMATEEYKKKFSEIMKITANSPGRLEKQSKISSVQNLGRHWWTNGKESRFQEESPGDEWMRGTKPGSTNFGRHWYTNGIENVTAKASPGDGWVLGRTSKKKVD